MTTWEDFLKWFYASPIASWLRVFVTIVLGEMLAEWTKLGTFDLSNWKNWLFIGVLSVGPLILRWLNPQDPAFGKVAVVRPLKKVAKK